MAAKETSADAQFISVWGRMVRLFHWINVICVLLLATLGLAILNEKAFGVSSDGKILLKTLHVYVGYLFALNLICRLGWAFFGDRNARWKAILPFQKGFFADLRSYLRSYTGGKQEVHVVHNPLSRLMITFLFLILTTQALTGLVLAGTDLYMPPFGGTIAAWVSDGDAENVKQLVPGSKENVNPDSYNEMRAFRKPYVTIHEYVFYVIAMSVFLHIAGVVTAEFKERNGIISAMVTGKKVRRS